MDNLENLNRKIHGATDIKSVVKTMKSLAAANIGQYETAVASLGDYYKTVALGLSAYFSSDKMAETGSNGQAKKTTEKVICALVFGSDQGLVGAFNDSLTEFVSQTLHDLPGQKEVWAIGGRIQSLLSDSSMKVTRNFLVPGSIAAITPLIGEILVASQEGLENGTITEFYIFYNRPKSVTGYLPVYQRILPLDKTWRNQLMALHWPTKLMPQIIGSSQATFLALVQEFLFVSLFRAYAESLASENSSRLAAMQRAEKNIEELLDNLAHKFHLMRQSTIDEELFDVLAGFEALKSDFLNK